MDDDLITPPESFNSFEKGLDPCDDHLVELLPSSYQSSVTTSTPVALKRRRKTFASSGTGTCSFESDCPSASNRNSHPSVSEMVTQAIEELDQGGGSTLKAIKKFISVNYEVKSETLSQEIKEAMRSVVAEKKLVYVGGYYKFREKVRRSKRLAANRKRKENEAQMRCNSFQIIIDLIHPF